MGGKGGGGGGGNSGKIEFPEYFQTFHKELLNDDGSTSLDTSLAAILNEMWASNPYTSAVAYDPTTPLSTITDAADAYLTYAQALSPIDVWETYLPSVYSAITTYMTPEAVLAAEEAAFNAAADADFLNSTLPTFQRGMQDIGAVLSSSYVTGQALIAAEVTRKKAQFSADLRLHAFKDTWTTAISGIQQMVTMWTTSQELYRSAVQATMDSRRMYIIAMKEQLDENLILDEHAVKWDMEVITGGGNVLAAAQGAVSGIPHKNKFQTLLNNVGTGGAIGGLVGLGVTGAVLGGVFGKQWFGD